MIGKRFVDSFWLMLVAWSLSGALGFFLGVLSGTFEGRALDKSHRRHRGMPRPFRRSFRRSPVSGRAAIAFSARHIACCGPHVSRLRHVAAHAGGVRAAGGIHAVPFHGIVVSGGGARHGTCNYGQGVRTPCRHLEACRALSRGRNACYQASPVQTRTCGFLASGSSVVLAFAKDFRIMQILDVASSPPGELVSESRGDLWSALGIFLILVGTPFFIVSVKTVMRARLK